MESLVRMTYWRPCSKTTHQAIVKYSQVEHIKNATDIKVINIEFVSPSENVQRDYILR